MDLPLPIASLLRRARNAKSPKERHDTAYFAWEASLRLAVAARPPADASGLAMPSTGHWVGAFEGSEALLDRPALLAAFATLTEVGLGKRSAPKVVTARILLEPLAAYRNQVIGHGSTRAADFYERAAGALLDGLEAAWATGVFWPDGARLLFVDAIEIDAAGARRARTLELRGLNSIVENIAGASAVPDAVLPRRVYLLHGGAYRSLHPWLLYQEAELRERVLFFNGRGRSAQFLDYVSGEALKGKPLSEAFPALEADLDALFTRAHAPVLRQAQDERGGAQDQRGGAQDQRTDAEGETEAADPSRFGDYRLLGKLGQGGMGVVYLARQEGLGRVVALKMLPLDLAQDPVAVARFKREVSALSRCDHPNVVKIHASGEAQGTHYYAMELVEGADLAQIADALSTADDFDSAVSSASERVRKAKSDAFAHIPDLRAAGDGAVAPAQIAGRALDRPRRLAALFRDAARGVHHLHEVGIIHRDLKPGNLMITAIDHRVVVMDLGLAALGDASKSITKDRGALLGTLRYMPPEQLQRNLVTLDRRADVYSLGATLYELVTDRKFFDGDSEARLIEQVLRETPVPAEKARRGVPRDLSVIIRKATEKDPARRYESAAALASDLDAFVNGRPIAARAPTLRYVLRLAIARHRALAATVAAAVVLGVAGTAWFVAREGRLRRQAEEQRAEAVRLAGVAEERRREAEAERQGAELLRRNGEAQLREIVRLADVKRLRDLERAAEDLWPAVPERVSAMETWLTRARELEARLPEHRATLAALHEKRKRDLLFQVEVEWHYETIAGLVADLERFTARGATATASGSTATITAAPAEATPAGAMASVEKRLEFAARILARSFEDHQEDWGTTIAAIADPARCPRYRGLRIPFQLGLVPLGQDPRSGLFEFAHLESGEPPERGPDGSLVLREETGIVFVLLPGGTFRMGAVRPEKAPAGEANIDAAAEPIEGPPHDHAVAAFFLSKYEMTQGQWLRVAGKNPSQYGPGPHLRGEVATLLDPVEQVTHDDAALVLRRLGLRLPSEAEWEYAARAGTATAFITGAEARSLEGAANVADRYCKENGGPPSWKYEEWLDDGRTLHAPVGSYRPSAFGLHDMAGNVWEWCADWYDPGSYARHAGGEAAPPAAGQLRVIRGGSWRNDADGARAARRNRSDPANRNDSLGLRPARGMTE